MACGKRIKVGVELKVPLRLQILGFVLFAAGLAVSEKAGALAVEPWLPQPYWPQFDVTYTYSNFRNVANATRQLSERSHDQKLVAGVGMATLSEWAGDMDIELARTPRFPWGFRSVGAQLRKQWFNDIVGDFATLTTGLTLRIVPPKPLTDVSTPYHYKFNGEFNVAIGKEWSHDIYWRGRIYNFTGIGVANRGSFWVRSMCVLGLNREDKLQFQTFILYYRGFGDQIGVNTKTSQFNGWKVIDHRSLDWGLSFRYAIKDRGVLTFEVSRRLYARSYPEKVTFFVLRYDIPLSF